MIIRNPAAASGGLFRRPVGASSVEPAPQELLEAMARKGRTIKIAQEGSEEMRYLDFIGAEANVGGEDLTHMLLRPNPGKAAALEEFLHGTQWRIGLVKELGVEGAERHVKLFMIRHRALLGLIDEDVEALIKLLRLPQ